MKFLKIAVFLISLTTFAQSKVGTVDIDFILANMPEMENVQQQLQIYGSQLDLDLTKKVDEYKDLAAEYSAGEATFTEKEKMEKQNALRTLDADIGKFNKKAVNLWKLNNQENCNRLNQKMEKA